MANWSEVRRSYKAFAQCDDGAIGEGYSDSVARLLSDNWASLDQLSHLVEHDNGFEKFILRHVDELMSPAQARKIFDNATLHCPSRVGQLCRAVIARIGELPEPTTKKENH